jgi:hypothetical protein
MGWGRGRRRGIASMINIFNRMSDHDGGPIVVTPSLSSLVGRGEVQVEENNSGGSNIIVVRIMARGS